MFYDSSPPGAQTYNEKDSVIEWYSTLFSLYGNPDGKKITQEQQYSALKVLNNDIIITPPGTQTYNAIRIFNFTTYIEDLNKPFMYVKCKGTGTTPAVSLSVDIIIDLSDAKQMRYGDYFRYELTESTINMYTKATILSEEDEPKQYEQTALYEFEKCNIALLINSKKDEKTQQYEITPLHFDLVFTSTWGDYTAKITASPDNMSTLHNSHRLKKNAFLKMNQASTITKIIAFSDGEIPYETHPIPVSLKGSRDTFTLNLLDYKGDVIDPINGVYNTLFAIQYFIKDPDVDGSFGS